MDDLILIDKLKKRINATLQQIGDAMITGGVDSMEKYKYLLGQAQAYQIINQEISNLLKEDEKEQNDGNVIDIKGSTKN
jgi:acetyl-CoA acetyltransferase|tara:strand:+ start:253 stop:489 length:237 start_codon:yes stop_codon:yes gene_type:complete